MDEYSNYAGEKPPRATTVLSPEIRKFFPPVAPTTSLIDVAAMAPDKRNAPAFIEIRPSRFVSPGQGEVIDKADQVWILVDANATEAIPYAFDRRTLAWTFRSASAVTIRTAAESEDASRAADYLARHAGSRRFIALLTTPQTVGLWRRHILELVEPTTEIVVFPAVHADAYTPSFLARAN